MCYARIQKRLSLISQIGLKPSFVVKRPLCAGGGAPNGRGGAPEGNEGGGGGPSILFFMSVASDPRTSAMCYAGIQKRSSLISQIGLEPSPVVKRPDYTCTGLRTCPIAVSDPVDTRSLTGQI